MLHSANLGRLAAFIQTAFESLGLKLVPLCPPSCAFDLPDRPRLISNSFARPLEPGASFSFELTGKRGAALVTKYQTYKQDALKRAAFERYTKKHYASWVAFSREKEYGDDVKPVLVSGVDMTKDFAIMAAYSNEGTSLGAEFTISVPMLASASAAIGGRGVPEA